MVFDEHLVVPDTEKSLEKGAVLPWRRGNKRMLVYYKALLRAMTQHYGQGLETPWKDLPEDFRKKLLHGTGSDEVEFTFWRAGKMIKAQKAFDLADDQFLAGALTNLDLLTTEQSLISIDASVAVSDTALVQDQIAVFKALGGGWRGDARQ